MNKFVDELLDRDVRDAAQLMDQYLGNAEVSHRPTPYGRTPAAREARVMIVDDDPLNIRVVRKFLERDGYRHFVTTTDPTQVEGLLPHAEIDVLLLDVVMPQLNGIELLRRVRADERFQRLPILILSASTEQHVKLEALMEGATDFLSKPVDPYDLLPRVRNALVLKAHAHQLQQYAWQLEEAVSQRTQEMLRAQHELIECLAQAAEFRDRETGRHVIRVARYTGIICRALNLPPRMAELIEQAAPLHDIGKIGVPDSILLKPGKLDDEEWEIMRRHCGFGIQIFEGPTSDEDRLLKHHTDIGARILRLSKSPILEVASRIALTHHEHWDGQGYPLGLSGREIPIEGRIVAVADVFDALTSHRPYKPSYSIDQSLELLAHRKGKQFDPEVLDAFFSRRAEVAAVCQALADVKAEG